MPRAFINSELTHIKSNRGEGKKESLTHIKGNQTKEGYRNESQREVSLFRSHKASL